MTRAEKIFTLKRRYHELTKRRMWKAANVVWVKLHEQVNRQLKWENRRA
jgi:hypothetical protein